MGVKRPGGIRAPTPRWTTGVRHGGTVTVSSAPRQVPLRTGVRRTHL